MESFSIRMYVSYKVLVVLKMFYDLSEMFKHLNDLFVDFLYLKKNGYAYITNQNFFSLKKTHVGLIFI